MQEEQMRLLLRPEPKNPKLLGLVSYAVVIKLAMIVCLVTGVITTAFLFRRWVRRESINSAAEAILVCGGGQTQRGPPPHVAARLELAKKMYDSYPADSKPKIIVSGRGTPHKPGPHDDRGFERPECEDNARWLVQRGVPDSDVLEESASLETIGNAYFARLMHTDVRGYRNLVIINSDWHMARTRDVYSFVFGLPHSLGGPAYKLKSVLD